MTGPNRNSMTIWFPAVLELSLPHPRTLMLSLDHDGWGRCIECDPTPEDIALWEQAAATIGYPLFLRSDLTSGKHSWIETCYVPSEAELVRHVCAVVQDAELCWLPAPDALAFREFVPLESAFLAFNRMPVAMERRYFAEDGVVRCHHPYWPAGAIRERFSATPLPEDWEERLAELNRPRPDEIELAPMACAVTAKLGGAWSVDFARTQDGRWLLIDMARAEDSYHEEHTP